jgi:hypothetical protein
LTLRVNQSLAKTAASVNYPSARLPRLTQIDAPFSSRLSRDSVGPMGGKIARKEAVGGKVAVVIAAVIVPAAFAMK